MKRMVVKVGGGLFETDENLKHLPNLVTRIAILIREQKKEVCLVSSGAIKTMERILGRKALTLAEKQAFASMGQILLMQNYHESFFSSYKIRVGQILLIYDDLDSLTHRKNAQNTIEKLFSLGAIPVFNENDTTATEEIRWGDNDPLAAMVAQLIEADLLILLTDVQGVYNPSGRLIEQVKPTEHPQIEKFAYHEDMKTKLESAKKATEAGIPTFIASWQDPEVLLKIAKGKRVGAKFLPNKEG